MAPEFQPPGTGSSSGTEQAARRHREQIAAIETARSSKAGRCNAAGAVTEQGSELQLALIADGHGVLRGTLFGNLQPLQENKAVVLTYLTGCSLLS